MTFVINGAETFCLTPRVKRRLGWPWPPAQQSCGIGNLLPTLQRYE